MGSRYTFGGDEHILVELDEEMSLEAFFKGLVITKDIRERKLPAITEIQSGNASYQIKFNPDITHPNKMLDTLKEIEANTQITQSKLQTRIIEMPVFYNDPWTHEALMRFRSRHQDPNATDLEYAARINGFDTIEGLIDAHSNAPWFVSQVGFVTGVPWFFQMVERARQIQVPKYLSPRTFTPRHTIGVGGCFTAMYSVQGAGGYQMFGITPVVVWDPTEQTRYFKGEKVFFRPGDIVKWKQIGREDFDRDVKQVEAGVFEPRIRPVAFSLDDFNKDIDGYNAKLLEVLYAD